jgi:methylisocitrate lyase
MRTVRESIRAGIAGIHIEDQLYPKRAHYHTYVAHNIPRDEYRDKIRFACEQRDELDKDFVIIARSDACRIQGYKEAIKRVNIGARQGADMTMIFPRNHKEAVNAPKDSDAPMVHVLSRGARDGRPMYSYGELEDMGYAAVIDATLAITVNYYHTKMALAELKRTGNYTGISAEDFTAARKGVEEIIGLDESYRVERATVEKGKRAKARR